MSKSNVESNVMLEPEQIFSDLELMVIKDMYENGYDFLNPQDVKQYWDERLPK